MPFTDCHRGISTVILSLRLTGFKRAQLRSTLARYKNALVVIAASVLTLVFTLKLLAPVSAPDLSQTQNASRVVTLTDSWAHGDVIALVRHGERCDRSSSPCLGPEDGVTVHGEGVVRGLGADFEQLGLKNVDVYSSLLTRARQTADAMFVRPVEAQGWLFNCRGMMLSDALKHKVPGRNLVLVTHSECMDELEKDLHVPTDTTFGYGSTLFIKADGTASQPQMLGYIDPKDWGHILSAVKTPVRHSSAASQF